MNMTPYHAKYFAHALLRSSSSDGIEKISRSLFDAAVDLNPHQIDAALFALKSPLSNGVILADEVGLGKTIEASIVLCQFWAERKRRILIVCPAALRKQWNLELVDKFNIPSIIIAQRNFRELITNGYPNPFEQDKVIICSYQFLHNRKELAKLVKWDLAIVDEAHKLRSAYRPSNVLGQSVKWALEDAKKLLLTATPLQNSLMELFGLCSIIDDYVFGDSRSFRQNYVAEEDIEGLKTRLRGFCKRTLRRQVLAYIPFTNRKAITIKFAQAEKEYALYRDITDFLQQPDTYALPTSQRSLITLVIRKILASSSYALIATLETIKKRLEQWRAHQPLKENIIEALLNDEALDDEEFEELESKFDVDEAQGQDKQIDLNKLNEEILRLDHFIEQAKAIKVDSKTCRLKEAIEKGFTEAAKMKAQRKVVVFTESRRTQSYLKDYLDANGYAGRTVIFNGTNTDPESKKIYEDWLAANQNTGRISGVQSADRRNAILEYFRDKAEILIATESAAEGINLQFCSLVINYDLPWNPQRIEQRIGRCHRYGQEHDVVVINFLNERNDVDRRVYELLEYKFKLFDGVFGASDEVLGSLESGVDFEKEVLRIYQECRKPQEIQTAFASLQKKMDEEIQNRLKETREILIEHFDRDVHERLKVNLDMTREHLSKMERRFWAVTRHTLGGRADFDDALLQFNLRQETATCPPGCYQLISKQKDKKNIAGYYLYRMSHPLGEHVLETACKLKTPPAKLTFDISNHPVKISVIEQLKGKSGWLILVKLTIHSFEKDEYLLFNAFDDKGKAVHPEVCEKLFDCMARVKTVTLPEEKEGQLKKDARIHAEATINAVMERSNIFYKEECDRLFRWADDLMLSAEKELKDTKNQLRELNRQLRLAINQQERLNIELKIKSLSKKQREQRRKIFDVEDEIAASRDTLIDQLRERLEQKVQAEELFKIRWCVV
ncbi:MAG: RNA polymerase-associated protein RapA [Syntrophus sp. PtaB.Bin075]|nr:MAG: RNA polymerase-associated protein RapA [Syntrophus sp. PtaB.Bin075]